MWPWINATTHTNEPQLNEKDYSNHLGTQQIGLTRVFVSLLDTMQPGVKGKQGCGTKTKQRRRACVKDSITSINSSNIPINGFMLVCYTYVSYVFMI